MNRPRGGKNSEFEKNFNSKIAPLKKTLKIRSEKISKTLTESLISGQTSTAYWNKVRASINDEYRAMSAAFNSFANKEIPLIYRSSLSDIQRRINKTKNITNEADKAITAMLNSTKVRNVQALLYQDAVSSFSQALASGREQLYRFTRKTQQKLVDESLIDATVAKSIEAGDIRQFYGRLTMASPAWEKTLDAAGKSQYIEVAGRRYKADYYAEMVARTKFHDAQASAALAQASNYKTDLLLISSHNTTTPICKVYEGRIFSISGKDTRFPPLEDSPPFHPNCLHLAFPYFESAMQAEGTTQAWSDFSLGNTRKPPSPASYNPLSAGRLPA